MKHFLIILFCCLGLGSMQAQVQLSPHRLKVGLVLGGGGAKGAAEVGVLKAIEKAGIPIDYIAGTSIGSIVGGLYSCGYRAEQLDSLFCSQKWLSLLGDRDEKMGERFITRKKGVTYLLGFPVFHKKNKFVAEDFGAIKGDKIVELLEHLTRAKGVRTFDHMPIPFRCVATDFIHQKEVVISQGNLSKAMRASMAIPGVFKPISIKHTALFDGGMVNNLPVDVVRAMGADIVIAIDLTQNKHEGETLQEAPLWLRLLPSKLAQMAVWAIERPDLLKYKENRDRADLYINPDLEEFGATSFSRQSISKMIRRGEEAGEKKYTDLLELHQRIFGPETAP